MRVDRKKSMNNILVTEEAKKSKMIIVLTVLDKSLYINVYKCREMS